MAHLLLRFLGGFEASLNDTPLTFATDKARALLAYLAVESGQAHTRSSLAALLWPDYPEENARTTLRHVLHLLRQLLGDDESPTPYLLITRQTLQFNSAAPHTLDVATFTSLLCEVKTHAHDKLESCEACLAQLRQAIELYRGDFLADLSVHDSTAFEEWRRLEQERLHLQAVNALTQLAAACEANGDDEQAHHLATRLLALEPYSDQACCLLMRAWARMEERNAALTAYRKFAQVLRDDLSVEPQPATTELYEAIRAGKFTLKTNQPAALVAPPPSPSPNNLPAHLAPFVGREHELAEIAAQLQQPGVRLLTLIGPGGMGKTRLAVEAAHARLATFADGVFFVSLAPLAEAASIPSAIAAAVGLALRGGDPKDTLINALREKRLLLVLDNFEHVLAEANFVVELLQAAPNISVIVTSRERLNVRGESIYMVSGMSYAHEQAMASPAVQLFAQSARRVYPGFELNETNLPKVQRLCHLVDGLPLGLELAAAWVEMLPLDTIAAEIERSTDFLTSDWRDAPERHRSLRAVFDWSWRLLNEVERKVYRQLSVFRGGFTREAAQAVVGASLQVLKGLSHKSLLRNADGRYEIHELLRQFASQELDIAPGEREAAEARHSQFYMAFVTARESGLKVNQPHQAIAEIRAEIDNFRQAWGWATAHPQLDEIYAATHTVWMFYQAAAPLQEQERMFGLAVEGLQAALDSEPAASARTQSIQQVLSKLLAYYARTFNAQGRHQLALPLAQRATQVGAANGGIGGIEGEAMGYLVWGQALSRMSQPEEAHERLQRALQLSQRYMEHHAPSEPLRDTEWITYIWLTTNSLALNKPHQARAYLVQGQTAFLTSNNPRGETTYLVNHADVDIALGEYDAAQQKLRQALRIARQSAQPWAEGFALVNLGKISLYLGEYSASSEYLHQGQKVMHEMGDAWQQAQALSWLSRLNTYMGAYTQAEEHLQQLTDVVGWTPSPEVKFLVEFARARLLLGIGDHEKSLAHAQSASQAAEHAHNRVNTASALILVGHSHAGLRQVAQAADVYQQALSSCLELGNVRLAIEPQAGLAALALAQSDPTALTHVEEALRVLAEHPRAGLDEPFDVYLMCYRVLNAYNDPRAVTVLQTAQRLLQNYAEHIHNDALRQSFEETVPTHRALRAV